MFLPVIIVKLCLSSLLFFANRRSSPVPNRWSALRWSSGRAGKSGQGCPGGLGGPCGSGGRVGPGGLGDP